MNTESTNPPNVVNRTRRRWWQFSLRALLILTLVCAVPCGWFGGKLRDAARQNAAVEFLIESGIDVEYSDVARLPKWFPKFVFDWMDRDANFVRSISASSLVQDFGENIDVERARIMASIRELKLEIAAADEQNSSGPPAKQVRAHKNTDSKEGHANSLLRKFEEWEGRFLVQARRQESEQRLRRLELQLKSLPQTDDRVTKCVGECARLERLNLNQIPVTDSDLANLRNVKGLKSLHLSHTNISDAGIAHLKKFTDLEFVSLESTQVSDEGLKTIERFRELRGLSLRNTRVTRRGIKHLRGMTKMRSIVLSCDFGDDELAHLAGMTKLEQLILPPSITSDGLKHVANMKQLRALTLVGSKVTDDGLIHLQDLRKLFHLNLMDTRITGTGFAHLKQLNSITRLYLSGTDVDDNGLEQIAHIKQIELLTLDKTQVTDVGIAHLRGLPNLETLSLGNTSVSFESWPHFASMPKLTGVELSKLYVSPRQSAELERFLPSTRLVRVSSWRGPSLDEFRTWGKKVSLVRVVRHPDDESKCFHLECNGRDLFLLKKHDSRDPHFHNLYVVKNANQPRPTRFDRIPVIGETTDDLLNLLEDVLDENTNNDISLEFDDVEKYFRENYDSESSNNLIDLWTIWRELSKRKAEFENARR